MPGSIFGPNDLFNIVANTQNLWSISQLAWFFLVSEPGVVDKFIKALVPTQWELSHQGFPQKPSIRILKPIKYSQLSFR